MSNAEFNKFLQDWTAKNIGDLGDRTDPSDHRYYYSRLAEQLKEDGGAAGFAVQVQQLGRDYKGGLPEFIEGAYGRSAFRRKHGDGV